MAPRYSNSELVESRESRNIRRGKRSLHQSSASAGVVLTTGRAKLQKGMPSIRLFPEELPCHIGVMRTEPNNAKKEVLACRGTACCIPLQGKHYCPDGCFRIRAGT